MDVFLTSDSLLPDGNVNLGTVGQDEWRFTGWEHGERRNAS